MDVATTSKGAKEVVRSLAAIAEQLERGQAGMPLLEQVQALSADNSDPGLAVFLLGLTPEARACALAWLVGRQYQSVSIKLAELVDLIEIRLQERGFTLETEAEGRRDFETVDALIEAYGRVASDAAGPVLDPVRLGLVAPMPLQNLTILVPSGPQVLTSSGSLLGRISQRNALFAVAASSDHVWTDQDRQSIAMLLPNTLAVWPIVCGNSAAELASENRSWLATTDAPLFPAACVRGLDTAIPDFVQQGQRHPLRIALRELAVQRGATRALDMIAERFQADLRQVQSRQKREIRLERASDSGESEQDQKLQIDRLKVRIADDLAKVQQAIRESNRRALLKGGDLAQVLEKLLASLHAADLDREALGRVIKLTLKPEVLENFRRRLGKALRQQLDEECTLIRDSIDLARKNTEKILTEVGATTRSISMVPPDNRGLWEPLEEMLQLDIKYRGELPHRGFMQRLGEGRRVVFVVLMVLSLAGSFVGFNIRQAGYAGIVFLGLFIGTVIYTYRAWRTEEVETLSTEIDKVRDSVGAELLRVLNDILREKQTRFQQMFEELKRDAVARVEAAGREAHLNRAQATDGDRRDAKTKLRLIEQRLREMQPLGQQIERLRSTLDQLGRDTQTALRQLLAEICGAKKP